MTSHTDPRILVAEADDTIRLFSPTTSSPTATRSKRSPKREAALDQLVDSDPDLIVVDVNGDTLGLLDALRSGQAPKAPCPADCPAIALTSHADELHRVRLLERGADDVVAKPFSYPELRARIAAVLRRMSPREPRPTIDRRTGAHRRAPPAGDCRAVRRPRRCRRWSSAAVRAGRDPSRVYTRAELLRDVWDHRGGWSTRTVDSHAHRLRAKLGGADQPLVLTVWGVGYRLVEAG